VPVMGVPPDFLDVKLDVAAEVYWCVFLAHAEAVVMLERLKGSAVVAHVFQAPLNDDEVFVDLWRGSPIPMVLVARPRGRQAIARPELINRAGFAIIPGPDTRLGALVGWQRIVDCSHLTHHLGPTELVGNGLRQKRLKVHLGLRGFETDS